MSSINRNVLFETFSKHETVTFDHLKELLNTEGGSNENHLEFLLEELGEEGYLKNFEGVTPSTYTITDKGLEEAGRLREAEKTA